MTRKRTGTRTSLIADPPDGRIPPLTGEAQKAAAADEEFRLALLQATDTCKNNAARCNGGKYDPRPSPRRAEPPPPYNPTHLRRIKPPDGPRDGPLTDPCLSGRLPRVGAPVAGRLSRSVPTPCRGSVLHVV